MFQIGDKIFYPVQGGGVIQTIEEKEILGENHLYYTIEILNRNMRVMIPTDKTEKLGLRRVVDPQILEDVFATFHNGETETAVNDSQRDRNNMNKIKSGDIYEGAQVIRDLMRINKIKRLGTANKNLLDNAMQILISEVMLVKDISESQAANLLDQVINAE